MSGAVGRTADASWLRGDPAALLQLLEHPGVFRAVAGSSMRSRTASGLVS
jgi:hypothetical protein